jgi:hypothetical protein
MRPTNILRTIAAVALLTAPAAVSAQGRGMSRPAAPAPTNDRDGYSLSLGLGGASSAFSSPGAGSSDRQNSPSGYLRLGKGFTPSVMLGVELNGWNKTEDQVTSRTGMLSAIAQWYPSMTNGFFAKGGMGLGRTTVEDKTVTPSDKVESTGFGYQVGMGYDMSITRRWSITPYVNYLATAGANAKFNGVDANTKLDANYFQYGLGLTWH